MRMKWAALAALGFAILAQGADAKDRALIVDLSNYKHLTDLPSDGRINAIRSRLISEGFEVDRLDNPTLSRIRAAVFSLEAATPRSSRSALCRAIIAPLLSCLESRD